MQIFHQSFLSEAMKSLRGALRSVVLLCAVTCLLPMHVNAAVENVAMYEGDTLLWLCQQLFETNSYTDPNDAAHKLNLKVLPKPGPVVSEEITVNEGDTLLWRCMQLFKEGVYKDTLWNSDFPTMALAYYQLTLSVSTTCADPVVAEPENVTICSGDSYTWHGQDYSAADTYEVIEGQVDGCGGTKYTLVLSVTPPIVHDEEVVTASVGDVVLWRCKEIACTEAFADSLIRDTVFAGDCVSEVYRLRLKAEAPCADLVVAEPENVTICSGNSYTWHGQDYSVADTYEVIEGQVDGCGGTKYTLVLSVTPPVVHDEEVMTASVGDTLLWRCKEIACTEAFADSLIRDTVFAGDCVSEVYRLRLKAEAPCADLVVAEPEDVTICSSETYTWHGQDYSVADTYEVIEGQVDGCGGTKYTLNLHVNVPTIHDAEEATVNLYDTVLWHCREIVCAEVFADSLFTDTVIVDGCPNEIYQLRLTVGCPPVLKDSVLAVAVSSDSLPYIWRTGGLTESGEYHDQTYYEGTDCVDSTFTLNLKVEAIEVRELYDTLRQGDTLLWHCMQLDSTDVYYDTLRYASGNDSIRYELHLLVYKDSITPVDVKYLTPDSTFEWVDGNTYMADNAGEYTYQTKYVNGCDSILFRMQIIRYDSISTISCDGLAKQWRDQTMDATGLYRDTVFDEPSIFTEEKFVKELYLNNFTLYAAAYDSTLSVAVSTEDLPYYWRTGDLNESGEYHDQTYYEGADCVDSTFTLNLKVEAIEVRELYDTLRQGDTLLWHCMQLDSTDIYYDTLRYTSGNDSIRYELHLLVYKDSITPVDVKYLTPDSTFEWVDGNTYTADNAGEYTYQTKYVNGCDSILFRMQIIRYDSTFVVSCGEPIDWRGADRGETNIYRDTVFGEPSMFTGEKFVKELYVLNLKFYQTAVDSVKNDTISAENLPYIWRLGELTESGEYHDTIYFDLDSLCIDSLFTLNLKVEPVESIVKYDTLCQGDTLLWRCMLLDSTGVYYDTLRYESGNDSVRFEYHLTIHESSIAPIDSIVVCNGDDLPVDLTEWKEVDGDGYNYQRQTYYTKTLYQQDEAHGCDSVLYRMYLLNRQMRDTTLTDTICDLREYTWTSWHDTTFVIPEETRNAEYTFTDTVRYAGTTDCDSVRYTMKIYVRRIEGRDYTTMDSICAADGVVQTGYEWVIKEDNNRVVPITLSPAELAKTGKFIVTRDTTLRYTPTSKGYECDSAHYTLNLYVFRPQIVSNDPLVLDTVVTDTTLCYSDAMEWYGQTYTIADANSDNMVIREHVLKYNGTDCDSIHCRLELSYRAVPDTTIDNPITMCMRPDDPIIWRGKSITEGGTYLDSTYYEGTQCIDRYYKLEVVMLAPTFDTVYHSFCHGSGYTWQGHFNDVELTASGWYHDTIPYTVLGSCDSVVHVLYLSEIVLDSVPAETQYMCDGESYSWRNKTYTQTGVYRDTIQSIGGCDSLYYILNLEQRPARSVRRDTMYICGTSGEVIWEFNGQTYTHSGEYSDTTRLYGCIDVIGYLRVITQPLRKDTLEQATIYRQQTYHWHGHEYSEPGTYEDTEFYETSGCDSAHYTLLLTVVDRDYRIVDVTDIVCDGDTYEEHGKQHIINGRTQFADTTLVTDPDGVEVYEITNYDIDVYDTSLPEGCLNAVVASCGLAINVDVATTMLEQHIENSATYAGNPVIVWMYREGSGEWKVADGSEALSGGISTVEVQCEVTTDCGVVSEQAVISVGKNAHPESFTEYDLLPVISKYNGTLLMVDIDAVCEKFGWTNGVEIKQEYVEWYERVDSIDNLSHPSPTDPKDIPLNKWGYYLTPTTTGDYYAIIKGKLEVEVDDCGVWARTMVAEGTSGVQLQPNVVHANTTVTVTGLTSEATMSITDIYGEQERPTGTISGTFVAPASAGTYFVTITYGGSSMHRTLIVCP